MLLCGVVLRNLKIQTHFSNKYWNNGTYFKMPYYAVAKGRTVGIFMSWADCEAQVKGYPGARYKKFDSTANAQDFITSESGSGPSSKFKKANSYTKPPSHNLKRSYSTSNESKSNVRKTSHEDTLSDNSDDLDDILSKQLDDVEKRLKTFEKGIDKIVSKSKSRKSILIDPPQKKSRSDDFETDSDGYVQVFTDGACSANGRSSARAGLGVFWAHGHPHNVSEPVTGRATNNCGEIQAATKAIKQALESGITKLCINTDSQFLINSVTKWIPGWKRKGWKLASGEPVKNETDFKDLDSVQNKLKIKWNYVEAHRGIEGNEMADQLAKAGAEMYNKK